MHTATTKDFADNTKQPGVWKVGGVVSAYRERTTKSGKGKIAFFQLEDTFGQLEVIVFPKSFERLRPPLVSDEPLLCGGKVVDEGEEGRHAWKMLLDEATPLGELRKQKTASVGIHLNCDTVSLEQVEELRQILASSRGSCDTTYI